ncbi:unnamed protein product [Effrenium voratum]|uniref:Uncharacterized protein n=1 Tax=Effrenium voratum TaxID=2562239 RepID=A0AA36IRY2_9DINO|nr:unnamed protein product [Effrenium voratum]
MLPLPVLLRAASRGKVIFAEDEELNTDNEQELLRKGCEEINTDNEEQLLQRSFRLRPPLPRTSAAAASAAPAASAPAASSPASLARPGLAELVSFAEELDQSEPSAPSSRASDAAAEASAEEGEASTPRNSTPQAGSRPEPVGWLSARHEDGWQPASCQQSGWSVRESRWRQSGWQNRWHPASVGQDPVQQQQQQQQQEQQRQQQQPPVHQEPASWRHLATYKEPDAWPRVSMQHWQADSDSENGAAADAWQPLARQELGWDAQAPANAQLADLHQRRATWAGANHAGQDVWPVQPAQRQEAQEVGRMRPLPLDPAPGSPSRFTLPEVPAASASPRRPKTSSSALPGLASPGLNGSVPSARAKRDEPEERSPPSARSPCRSSLLSEPTSPLAEVAEPPALAQAAAAAAWALSPRNSGLSPVQASFTTGSSSVSSAQCSLRRAECRFTRERETGWFCGVDFGAVDFECEALEVSSRERSILCQIFEDVDSCVADFRSPCRRDREKASEDLPALFAKLCSQLRIYHFQLREKRCVETLDGSAIIMELLSRVVEVLDALAPGGVESCPYVRDLVCDALNEALGPRGVFPLCVSYLNASPLEDAGDFYLELSFHALMALLLALLWDTPSRVTETPEKTIIEAEGFQAVFTLATDLVAGFENQEPWEELGLERLFLALHILRLGLRSTEAMDPVCRVEFENEEESEEDTPAVAQLARRALQVLSQPAAPEQRTVVLHALPAAVRLLGALLQVPPLARSLDFFELSGALHRALQRRPLTLALTAAFREMVLRDRPRRWFSMGPEAKQVRRDFFNSLDSENVLNELAAAATERVEHLLRLLQEKRTGPGASYEPCRQGMKDMAVQSLEEAVEIGSYFDNVEATVVAVYGKASVVEEMAGLKELRESLPDRPAVSSLEQMRQHLQRCFPVPNFFH